MCWFDLLDLQDTPFKTLRYHEKAVRAVGFHPRFPLLATAADDGLVHIFHAMVYADLLQNPLLVPLKVSERMEGGGGSAPGSSSVPLLRSVC